MALELRQQLKLTQQLIMTPQLQMAIKLLQLSRLELLDTIRQELEENPALEEVQESASEESVAESSDKSSGRRNRTSAPYSIAVDSVSSSLWSVLTLRKASTRDNIFQLTIN